MMKILSSLSPLFYSQVSLPSYDSDAMMRKQERERGAAHHPSRNFGGKQLWNVEK